MIISHKHKFIFIHLPKTGGSSITTALAKSLGPHDVQVGLYRETIPSGIIPPRAMLARLLRPEAVQAFTKRLLGSGSLADAVDAGIKHSFRRQLGRTPAHCSASHVAQLDPVAWSEYLKFCVVRNPFDRAVSDYYWRTRFQDTRMPFEEYVDKLYTQRLPPKAVGLGNDPLSTWEMYTQDGQVVMDFVIRFEALDTDFRAVCSRIGIHASGSLPKKKSEVRGQRDYRAMYSDASRRAVEELNRMELETFGYAF